jgi:hypothetical protein
MVLVRIGQPAVDDLKEFYVRNASRPRIRWVVEFVLNELGAQVPALEKQDFETSRKVLQLAKAAV